MQFQTKEHLSDQFRAIFKTNPDWLPSNVRRVKWSVITAIPQRNALGLNCDASEQTGEVVHLDDGLLILKVKPSQYCLVDPSLIPKDQNVLVGAIVTVQPYKRKSLEDGLPLDAPRSDGRGCTSMLIGETRTKLPGRPTEGYLSDLADQLEACPMPDGYRTMANALADWKATDFAWVSDDTTLTFELRFTIDAPAYAGPVTIAYDRACDTYTLRYEDSVDRPLTDRAGVLIEVPDIHFDELASHLSNLAGDQDIWCLVTMLPVSKSKAA